MLRLLVDGLTNGQIEAPLYVSPQSASVNVSATLRRLQAINRIHPAAQQMTAIDDIRRAIGDPRHLIMKRNLMSAIDIIRQWYDRISPNQYMGVIVTATQGGPPQGRRGQTTLFYTGVLTRSGQPGQLDATRGDILFADRQDTSRRPIQPFNALAADQSEFALLPTGTLREHSLTWNFTQEISLSAIGNNVLAGWGGSIGNTGQPSYWVIVVDNTVGSIPG